MRGSRLPCSSLHVLSYRTADSCPDLFFGTTRPASVLAGIQYIDRQIVPVLVPLSTRGASSAVVFAGTPSFRNMLKNGKLTTIRDVRWQDKPRPWPELLGHRQSLDQVVELSFYVIARAVKPEPPSACTTVNTQRSPDRIPKFARIQFILTREYFNAIGCATQLDGNLEPVGHVVDVQAAIPRQARHSCKDP